MKNKEILVTTELAVDNTDALKNMIATLAKSKVHVGVAPDKLDRVPNRINNATLAYIQDTGSPSSNIPARPFMIPGAENAREKNEVVLRQTARKVLRGDKAAIEDGLNAVGTITAAAIRAKIYTGPFAPLSSKTRRTKKGRALITTGQMRNSIGYVLVKGE
jgi:phage gpG-like protein